MDLGYLKCGGIGCAVDPELQGKYEPGIFNKRINATNLGGNLNTAYSVPGSRSNIALFSF